MSEEKSGRKSIFESLPSYLAGFAAVATATVAVLTYLHHQDVETSPTTEPEVIRGHVTAVPSMEVSPKPSGAKNAQANGGSQAAAGAQPTQARSLNSALHPVRCPAYLGTWALSTGEQMSVFDNERVEVRTGTGGAPQFGTWSCNGRNEEVFILNLNREGTLYFDASGDGTELFQRPNERSKDAPLSAKRVSGP